jgi:hypothetical protein
MSGTSLTLVRETARRLGVQILPDSAQWELRMLIESASSNRLYTVARRKTDGTWGCDCPGWKRWRNCKHLKAIVPQFQPILPPVAISADQEAAAKPRQQSGGRRSEKTEPPRGQKPQRPAPKSKATQTAQARPDKQEPTARQPGDQSRIARPAVDVLINAGSALDQAVTAMLASDLRGLPEAVKLVRAAQANLRRAQTNIRFDHGTTSA